MGEQSSTLLGEYLEKLIDDTDYANDKEKQIENIKKLFAALDTNSNGCIDGKELNQFFRVVCEGFEIAAVNVIPGEDKKLTTEEVRKLILAADTNKDRAIQFDEFVNLIESLTKVLKQEKNGQQCANVEEYAHANGLTHLQFTISGAGSPK